MIPRCNCGNSAMLMGLSRKGKKYYRSRCTTCRRRARKAKKGHCERCLTVPKDRRLLDVDHIDGNPANNEPQNLQTLCKPCHVVKTKENGEYKNREKMQQL